MMPNCAHYMAIWLGLTRTGVAVALLNTQLRGEVLAHCIRIVAPKSLIVGSQFCDVVPDVRAQLDPGISWWVHGPGSTDLPRLDLAVAQLPAAAVSDAEIARPSIEERALFIYTSGTTGLPKAANVSHFRVMQWSHWFAGMMATGPADRMYDCLPLYHSVGGVVATGATLVGGGTVILRDRFSARDFWRDVVEERCTLFQYIGELCRYLVGTPPSPLEIAHHLRLCCGNGLRGEVWEHSGSDFASRNPRVLRLHRRQLLALQLRGQTGAIGRIPPFLKHRLPVEIVRFDLDAEHRAATPKAAAWRCEPMRQAKRSANCSPRTGAPARFEGYADADAPRRRSSAMFSWRAMPGIAPGSDAPDEQGFFYFVDRVGDTFRWKGENVSAAEVSGSSPPARDHRCGCLWCYVPGADGRAGMAAIVTGPEFDLKVFRDHLARSCPTMPGRYSCGSSRPCS